MQVIDYFSCEFTLHDLCVVVALDLSLAVPFVNALALVLTSLTGLFLGETLNRGKTVVT